MSQNIKTESEILAKLNILQLNEMQKAAEKAISENRDTILLSPTGSGKTLAFLLPLLKELQASCENVQALILVPSRELAIQIEQVFREMGSGFKANAVYGGRAFSKDKIELQHAPTVLIGTPGRVADHLRRQTFSVEDLQFLILDEFDKSLETGFEAEMSEIIQSLPQLQKRVLTSATQGVKVPDFAGVKDPEIVDFLHQGKPELQIKTLVSGSRDKLDILLKVLREAGDEPGIIFCNFKESLGELSTFLEKNRIAHSCFFGGLDQKDRERALIKFRNGTHRLLLATDLAARGIDVPEINFIIHYELPLKYEEFTHRNGRTARMHRSGTAYVLKYEKQSLPEFIDPITIVDEIGNGKKSIPKKTPNATLFISGGRKDKISKGDIAGLFLKQGNLQNEELGNIELKQDCAFVAVPANKAQQLIESLNNSRLKKKKVRISKI
ncbi:DEAD/DEAH box helicase [Salinimicrobium sp. GXAS 041]|uniref:DEAD/DEAH box helicase n=1 Tax=Salinimicrobium sp. GXAS 041 TaxID=3400806 RepID=UPI003C76EC38